MADIETTIEGPIATILLNRPEKLNALTDEMYAEVAEAVRRFDDDRSCRVIVLRGAGRAFCAGFDLTVEMEGSSSADARRRELDLANRVRWAIWNSTTPVLAAVHGYCLAGGFEMTLPADFTIASDQAVFGEPESLFGAAPSFLQVPWLTSHKIAKDVLVLGQHISAQRAFEIGFVSTLVPDAEFDERVAAYAEAVARIAPRAVAAIKTGVNRTYEIAGMRVALEAWTDHAALLHDVDDEHVNSFAESVRAGNVSEAIKTRNQIHGDAGRP
ncbi:hypothetical protein GCM10027062_28910 [Nocardioides hungaricus]